MICNVCKINLTLDKFYWNRKNCKNCHKESIVKTKRTPIWLLSHMYSNQIKSSKRKWYKLPDYSRAELLIWATSQLNFNKLFNNRVKSWYNTMLIPSWDRLNDYKPYTLSNLRLVTWWENNKKAHKDMVSCINNKSKRAVFWISIDNWNRVDFISIKDAWDKLWINKWGISQCCRGNPRYSHAWRYIWKYKI